MCFSCFRVASIVISILFFAVMLSFAQQPQTPDVKQEYICQPCGCGCDDKVYEEAGKCPCCGMPLVVKGVQRKVAILIFEGVELLDFSGPLETFSVDGAHFETFTVAPTTDPVKTGMGTTKVTPTYSIDNAPKIDILVIPGGGIHGIMADEKVMNFIKNTSKDAEIVMSVCSGAFVLVKAGLLDGLKTTAHSGDLDELEKFAPKSTVVRDVRYVDNGKFICSGGVSAGIDASLYIIERLISKKDADDVAIYLQHVRRVK